MIEYSPFPHEVIRGFVPPGLVAAALAEWPEDKSPCWIRYRDDHADKYASRGWEGIGRAATLLIEQMACYDSELISGAWPDLALHGGGLHMIPPGGHLSRHLDAATHPVTGWQRVASGVLYLDDWRYEWGGALVLGEHTRIYPEAGMLIVFACRSDSWHAVETVTGPTARRSIALFWWGVGSGGDRTHAEFS